MDKKSIVLAGPQGSGKTTLCEYIQEKRGNEYIAVPTRKFMPEGINSHLDVLKMAVLDPQDGIDFQKNLITKRAELFRKNYGTNYVSDRSVFDSFVYYSMHNTFFATPEEEQELWELAKNSLFTHDLLVFLDPAAPVADDKVRITSNGYKNAYSAALLDSILRAAKMSDFVCVGNCYMENNLGTGTVYVNQSTGNAILIVNEGAGFMTSEIRASMIEIVLEYCEDNVGKIQNSPESVIH